MVDSPESKWTYTCKNGIVSVRNPDAALWFRAEGIRRAATGPHANVTIALGGIDLGDDTFNLGRSEERRKLAKTACRRMGAAEQKNWPLDDLEIALDRFCKRVWPMYTQSAGILRAGADEEPPPPTFALEPYLMEGGGTILFGPPGAGKSWITYLMAVSIDSGCESLWQPVKGMPVLFINLERSIQSVNRRIWRINQALGLAPNRRLRVLQARGKTLESVLEQARMAIEHDGYQVVMLDSISRAGQGDLNDNQTANSIVDSLSSLSDTWMAIGHCPRGDSTHIFGSALFEAGQDIGVKLKSQLAQDSDSLGIALEVNKGNDMPPVKMKLMALDFDRIGLTRVREARDYEFPDLLAGGKPASIETQVYDLLRDAETMTASTIADVLGCRGSRGNIAHLLTSDSRFERDRVEGKHVYYRLRSRETAEV
jgi:hypothetical protein